MIHDGLRFYLWTFLSGSAKSGALLLMAWDPLKNLISQSGNPFMNAAIHRFFPDEHESFLSARQQRGEPDRRWIHWLELTAILVGTSIAAAFFYRKRNRFCAPALKATGILVLLVVMNALVCAGGSGVIVRYQARVVWLIPLWLTLMVLSELRLLNSIGTSLSPIRPQTR